MRRPGRTPSSTDTPDPWRVPDRSADAGRSSASPASPRGSRVTEAPRQLSRQVTDLVRRLSGPEGDPDDSAGWPDGEEPRRGAGVRQIAQLAGALTASARQAGTKAVATGGWLAELVEDIAPHVTIRDLGALGRGYGCRGDA